MDLAYETVNIVYTLDCRTLSFLRVSTHEWNYSVIPSFSLNEGNLSSNITHWVSVGWLYAVNWNIFLDQRWKFKCSKPSFTTDWIFSVFGQNTMPSHWTWTSVLNHKNNCLCAKIFTEAFFSWSSLVGFKLNNKVPIGRKLCTKSLTSLYYIFSSVDSILQQIASDFFSFKRFFYDLLHMSKDYPSWRCTLEWRILKLPALLEKKKPYKLIYFCKK